MSLPGLNRRIDSHLACKGCDYDLFGLRYGGKCPECGTPIRPPARVQGSINDASLSVLRRLRTGVLMMLAASPAPLLAVLAVFLSASLGIALLLLAIAASVAWVYGVFIVTAPLPGHVEAESTPASRVLRIATRALTSCWFFVLLIPMAWRIGVSIPGVILYLLWTVAAIGAGVGFTLVSVSAARVASWANDPDLGHHLRGAAVAVALIAMGFLVLTSLSVLGVTPSILLFFYLATGLLALGIAAWNAYLYIRFAALLAWAPANAQKAFERARVRGERVAQRIAEAQAKPEAVPQFNVVKPPYRGVVVEESHAQAIELAPHTTQSQDPPRAPAAKGIHSVTTPLQPLPKRKPAPGTPVDRTKDEMI